jgi:glutamate-ammonia-ligase adenylyltransferase
VDEGLNPRSGQAIELPAFRDAARARQELRFLQSQVSAETFAALQRLLAASPDAGQALSLLERLARLSGDRCVALLESDHILLHYVLLLFGHSYWLGETLIQNPDLLDSLRMDKDFRRSTDAEDFQAGLSRLRARSSGEDVSSLLASYKKREYVRIVLRDLLEIATLGETTAEISALADVLIAEALHHGQAEMRRKYPDVEFQDRARFSVLSLGKLGGNELNYSSDVDLLYLYDGADAGAGRLSSREYFVRQAQLITETLSRTTAEGTVFRIDLRLRPQGQEGEPAVALSHALEYYAHSAHDWELQALIKARHSAGDADLSREFIRGVQPRVYVGNVNFAAVETAVNSRRKIGEHRRRALATRKEPAAIDVKLDRGGIRDIEFLAQCLQRVYGGEEPWLRACGTLFSLQKLNDKGHLSSSDFRELSVTYEFLRTIEHRLQLQRGQQLHRLPTAAAELQVLARAVLRDSTAGSAALMRPLRERMGRVAAIYERMVHHQKQRERGGAEAAADSYYIGARELSFDQLMRRLESDSPLAYGAIRSANLSVHGRRNLHRCLGSAMGGAENYAALLANPAAINEAFKLFETSDYLTDTLVRQPSLALMLPEIATGRHAPSDHARLFALDGLARDRNESLAILRRRFRRAGFALAARDVLSPRSTFVSLKQNTQLADAAIRSALRIVQGEQTLTVFALGRLGTEEFDIASDADLLFVRAPEADEETARLDAERLVHALSAYTKEGPLFAVDARLRPHGGQGDLVANAVQIERYLAEEAQPWEALTYSKLRFVAGRRDVAAAMLPIVWRQIVELASRPGFAAAVLEMRARLEKSNRFGGSFKLAAGGFYDIDFITSYLMLKQARPVSGNTQERLQQLHDGGLLTTPIWETLSQAAQLYRTTDHGIRLVTGRARPELPSAEHARKATQALVARILEWPRDRDIQPELRSMQHEVRDLFLRCIR